MKNYCDLEEKIKYISACEYNFFRNKANVVGVGLGYKIKKGFCIFKKCITVFVKRKFSLNKLSLENIIPKVYKGIMTDVIEIGLPKITSLRNKIRPVLGGYSIGVNGLQSGTMGCLVGDSDNDYILTCNHVIGGNSHNNIGKSVVQPSIEYGGRIPRDEVGKVTYFDEVILDSDNNYTDSAIAKTDRVKGSIDVAFLGPIIGIDNPTIGKEVQKVGSTSELTKGRIENKYVTININFLGRDVVFKNQITTTKMSEIGDSGAMLLNKKREAIGMLMADTDTISIYNSIHAITSMLNVHILRR